VLPVKVADALRPWANDQAVLHATEEPPDEGFVFTGETGATDGLRHSRTCAAGHHEGALGPGADGDVFTVFGRSRGGRPDWVGEKSFARRPRRLGHSNVTLTQDRYADLNLDKAETLAEPAIRW